MKLAICADHAGFTLKEQVKAAYPDVEWLDLGAGSEDPLDDYPDYAFTLAMAVAGGYAEMGIAICGTGAGMCMALNRHPMIRAAVCLSPDVAATVREHNDANVLCLAGRLMDGAAAKLVVDQFISTAFSTVEKYARRNRKLSLVDDGAGGGCGDGGCGRPTCGDGGCGTHGDSGDDHDHDMTAPTGGGCCGGGCH
jgi:ribose 5-phosphate isomerase B